MRLPILAGTALLSLAALPAHAQREFEGVITIRVATQTPQGGPPAQEVEYMVRGRKLRMNMGGPGGMSVLAVPAEQKLYMLMAAQNSYMEMPIAAAAPTETSPAATPDVKLTRTGRKETIAGFECEHILVASARETADMCVAKGLGSYVNPMAMMRRGNEPAWQKQLADEGFPLKVTDSNGKVALEVTRVERKRLDNTLFSVPEHYTRMPMPQRR